MILLRVEEFNFYGEKQLWACEISTIELQQKMQIGISIIQDRLELGIGNVFASNNNIAYHSGTKPEI